MRSGWLSARWMDSVKVAMNVLLEDLKKQVRYISIWSLQVENDLIIKEIKMVKDNYFNLKYYGKKDIPEKILDNAN